MVFDHRKTSGRGWNWLELVGTDYPLYNIKTENACVLGSHPGAQSSSAGLAPKRSTVAPFLEFYSPSLVPFPSF